MIPKDCSRTILISDSATLKLRQGHSTKLKPHKETNILLTSVAAQVHAETMPEAMRPGLTLREAVLNSSEFFGENGV
jgi:hypothetical protein